jgi:hypothetical protein
MVLAPPPMRMSLPPAASRACRRALSIPSLTKWNVVPPGRSHGSRLWDVRTYHRCVKGRFLRPETLAAVEHALAKDGGADARERLLEEAIVEACLAVGTELEVLPEEPLLERPALKLHPAAEPVLVVRVVGVFEVHPVGCDVAVDRHDNGEEDSAHSAPFYPRRAIA